jgi:hypothetical protein
MKLTKNNIMAHLKNKSNDYAKLLDNFDKIPKSVFAAIAVSYVLRDNNENFPTVKEGILKEWEVLYNNNIVPQKPLKG